MVALCFLLLICFISWKNSVDGSATDNTLTLESRLAVLHSDALCVLQLVLLFALDTVVNISHDIFSLRFLKNADVPSVGMNSACQIDLIALLVQTLPRLGSIGKFREGSEKRWATPGKPYQRSTCL